MRYSCLILSLAFLVCHQVAFAADLDKQIKALQSVGPKGAGHAEAMAAWREIAKVDPSQITQVLAGMDKAGVLADNWFRAAAETIADRAAKSGSGLPKDKLEAYLADTTHAARSRRLAFELLARVDATARGRLIPKLNKDPSLELRRDAIGMMMDRAAEQQKAEQNDAAKQTYQTALLDARDVDQVKAIAKALDKLGVNVDQQVQFGFVPQWQLIGPFDNREGVGFDAVYPPEREILATAEYEGLEGRVKWKSHATDDEFGAVDLNAAIGKHKGAVGYAYTEFDSAEARNCEIRIGCINANKVWINGKEIISNKVYHAGMDIDQYVGKAKLKKGKNTILVKVCQNEQTEPWAQRWQFQLRVCDSLGGAILDRNRKLPAAAAVARPASFLAGNSK